MMYLWKGLNWITQTKSQSGDDFLNHTNKITIWWWFSESCKQNHNLVMIFWITQTKSQSGDDFLNHTNKITIWWWFSESHKQNHNLVMIFWIVQTKSQSGDDFLNHTNKITIWWWFSESHKQNHNLVMIFWITQTKSQSGDDFQKCHWYGKVIFRQKKCLVVLHNFWGCEWADLYLFSYHLLLSLNEKINKQTKTKTKINENV